MVDGVMLRFSKEKMLKRLEKEDRMQEVTAVELAIMDNLDGCEVSSACWERVVKGEPVYSCHGKDGKVYPVFEGDCA